LKKEAKTFASAVADSPASARQQSQEFFGSFFQKRTATFHAYWRLLRGRRAPSVLECNLCFWRGAFLDRGSRAGEVHCPRCKSANRHRLIAWYFAQSDMLKPGAAFLHVAPEPGLREMVAARVGAGYETCDIARRDVDHRLDLQTQTVAAHKYDTIMINHVLEHVLDDAAVLANLRRMLKPGGVCLITVPMRPEGLPTDEDPAVIDPQERRRRFGQDDHVRIYGPDIVQRIEAAGFHAAVFASEQAPQDEVAQFSMNGEILFLATASGESG
jgi:SAM-dependent methyltransferase